MICNICGSDRVRKTKNDEIYGRIYGRGDIFLCDDCRSYVGCHPDGRPLGLLANKQMRLKKVACHSLFDEVWKNKIVPRGKLYGRLANILKIEKKDCHFGYFDIAMLDKCLDIFNYGSTKHETKTKRNNIIINARRYYKKYGKSASRL